MVTVVYVNGWQICGISTDDPRTPLKVFISDQIMLHFSHSTWPPKRAHHVVSTQALPGNQQAFVYSETQQ